MPYYIQLDSTGKFKGTWNITDDQAVRIDVSNAEDGPFNFRASSGETIWDCLRRLTCWFEPGSECMFIRMALNPGQYFPRIARPVDLDPAGPPKWSPGAWSETHVIARSLTQLATLTRQLDRICETVYPSEETFNTYGHEIRNLLILACTEAETEWLGVLVANGITGRRCTTKDYAKLAPSMRLDEYEVEFPRYPWLNPMKPYSGWSPADNRSQNLAWYQSYNAAKHDREGKFSQATLGCAFQALSAYFIILVAQYGPGRLGKRLEYSSFFRISRFPSFDPSEAYLRPSSGEPWSPVNYNFIRADAC